MDDLDQQYHEALQQGDTDAFAEYLQKIKPQLLAFIDRQIGDHLRRKVDGDDIFQDVSAEAVRNLAAGGIGKQRPFSWLCQIAEHRIIDAHRHYFGAQKRDAAQPPHDRHQRR